MWSRWGQLHSRPLHLSNTSITFLKKHIKYVVLLLTRWLEIKNICRKQWDRYRILLSGPAVTDQHYPSYDQGEGSSSPGPCTSPTPPVPSWKNTEIMLRRGLEIKNMNVGIIACQERPARPYSAEEAPWGKPSDPSHNLPSASCSSVYLTIALKIYVSKSCSSARFFSVPKAQYMHLHDKASIHIQPKTPFEANPQPQLTACFKHHALLQIRSDLWICENLKS